MCVLEVLPAGKISPRIKILKKAEHLPRVVSEALWAAKM